MSRFTVRVPEDYDSLSREELAKLVRNLLRVIRAQQAQIEALKRELEQERKHKGHAPFSKGPKKGAHKKPGRKKGQGRFTNRPPPDPSTVTDRMTIAPPDTCPHCGSSKVELDSYEDFSITDLSEPSPRVTAGRRAKGHCRRCGKPWRAKHPDVPDDQFGATAHRMGRRLRLTAHALHYRLGIPVRKVSEVLLVTHAAKVTQSALTQDALRAAESGPLHDRAQEIGQTMPEAPNVHVDPTGWRINGKSACLTTFATPDTATASGDTLYTIGYHHGADELIDVLGPGFQGTLNTDRGPEFRSKKLKNWRQQKCNTHLKRNVGKVLETKTKAARDFGEHLRQLLDEARQLHRDYQAGRRDGYAAKVDKLEARMTRHLRDRKFTDPDNQRLLNGIGREHHAGNILRFLHDPKISPDNHLAELQLRFAVIARKVSHCSKNDRGAQAHATLSTVFQTENRALRFEEKQAKKTGKKVATPSLVDRVLRYLTPKPPTPRSPDPPPPQP